MKIKLLFFSLIFMPLMTFAAICPSPEKSTINTPGWNNPDTISVSAESFQASIYVGQSGTIYCFYGKDDPASIDQSGFNPPSEGKWKQSDGTNNYICKSPGDAEQCPF